MSDEITTKRRGELASIAGINEQYLYQCLTGIRDMSPRVAMGVERATKGELRRWHVCTTTWAEIWPELIGTTGAPPVPVAKVAA